MDEYQNQINEFLTYCKLSKNLGEKTILSYRSDLKSYFAYSTENPCCNVMEYISCLSATNHKCSTIKRHLASLKQFFKFVYRNDRLSNPMLQYEFKLKSEKALPRTIPVHSVKKLLNSVENKKDNSLSPFQSFETTRDMALIDLLCSTGIRIGEAAAIRLEDIDLKSRIILIHGKGKKERLIYLSCQQTVDNLKCWISLRKTYVKDHNYLFVNRMLSPISIHAIEDIFFKYRDIAKINPKATPHYLRHTFATNLLANGADLRAVQEILGHSNISITERYTEVTTNRKIKVLKKYNYRNNI